MTIRRYLHSLYVLTNTDAEVESVEALEDSLHDMPNDALKSWMVANSIDFTSPEGVKSLKEMGLKIS